jgi:hypothetical protein
MKRHVKGGLAANKPLGLLAIVLLAGLACSDSSDGGGTGGSGGSTASGGSGGSRGGSGGSTGGSGGAGTGGASGGSTGGSTATGGTGGSTGGSSGTAGAGGATGGSGGAGAGGTTGDAGGSTGGAGGSAGDAAGPAAGPERFIGEWDYTVGQAMLACPGRAPISQNLGNDGSLLAFQAGAGVAPLILIGVDCNLRFDIQGQTAVVQPNQMCMNAIAGQAATSTPTAFTFELREQGAVQMSTWTVTFTSRPTMPCTLTAQGTLARI